MKKVKVVLNGLMLMLLLFILIITIGIISNLIPIFYSYIMSYWKGNIEIQLSDIPQVKDLLTDVIYLLQLFVTGVLSFAIFRLTKETNENEKQRIESDENKRLLNSVRLIKSEINYNISMLKVLRQKKIDLNKDSLKEILKIKNWEMFNQDILNICNSEDYAKILAFYATVNLCKIIDKDINANIKQIEDNQDVLDIINSIEVMRINKINKK